MSWEAVEWPTAWLLECGQFMGKWNEKMSVIWCRTLWSAHMAFPHMPLGGLEVP